MRQGVLHLGVDNLELGTQLVIAPSSRRGAPSEATRLASITRGPQLVHELSGDPPVDQHALHRAARLPGVEHGAPRNPARGARHVGIGQDDGRVVAAQFERHRDQALGGGLGDLAAGGRAAREDDAGAGPASIRAAPVAPSPCTMWNTSGGKPASAMVAASTSAIWVAYSDGLRITLLPAIKAATIGPRERYSG